MNTKSEISKTGGIPYTAWTDEIVCLTIKSCCINGLPDGYGGVGWVDEGGRICTTYDPSKGSDLWKGHVEIGGYQRIPKGSRSTIFKAEPKLGYQFIGWSDGYTGAVRVLQNVEEDMVLTAYFKRLSYMAEYQAEEGEYIQGETVQLRLTGEYYHSVTAVAAEGYRFVGWSDGVTTATRRDRSGQTQYDEQAQKFVICEDFTVSAIFEKLRF